MLKDKLIVNELAKLTKDDELERLRAEIARLQEQVKCLRWALELIDHSDPGRLGDYYAMQQAQDIARQALEQVTAPANESTTST